ncbi:MAG: AMP-binding protein [Flavobacteriaceae bacterium]|nr:AMP-binding protein [Flavobacteriaceae bacterium]MDG2313894.1 AMP-binding protein [Flavobacteriaceae bacterium]
MIPPFQNIHPQFRWNGQAYSSKELLFLANDYLVSDNEYNRSIGVFIKDWFNDSPTITLTTSGSTGIPKQIAIAKKAMVASALATGDFFNLQPDMTALLCLPANFIGGKMMIVRSWVLGLQLTIATPSQNPLIGIEATFDFCAMTPYQLQHSLGSLSQISILLVGGASVSETLCGKIQDAKARVFETYGMTETVSHIAVRHLNGKTSHPFFQSFPEVALSLDSRGCLVVHAPQISPTPVVTNDLVRLHGSSSFEWLGRLDSVVNSGGIKLIPEQIERALSSLFSQRFFVAGLPDAQYGQKLVLVVEGNTSEHSVASLKQKSSLPSIQLPKEVFLVTKFSETPSGKINRLAVLESLC